MDTKANYTVIGAFVIVLSIALIVILFWLTDYKHGKKYNTYLVYVQEEVTGLNVQSPVRYNGVPVGYVQDIRIDPNNPKLVQLTLRIEQGTPITTSTAASLMTQGITGVLYVGLKTKTVDAPKLIAKHGQKYPVIPEKPSLLGQISKVIPQVTQNIQEVSQSVAKVLDEKNREAISQTLQNLQKFTKTLANNSRVLDQSMKSLNVTLKNSALASKQFPKVMQQMDRTLTQLKLASYSLRITLNQGQVAIHHVSSQLLPTTQLLMSRLGDVANNLLSFTRELARNPSIVLRGSAPVAPGPGER